MAKEIIWDILTPIEAETLADLQASGKEIFATLIEIEHREQIESLGYTFFLWRRIENIDAECASLFIAYNLSDYLGYANWIFK